MLSNMKKDMGVDPGYKTDTEKREEERAKLAGWDSKNKRPIKPEDMDKDEEPHIHDKKPDDKKDDDEKKSEDKKDEKSDEKKE